MQDFGSTKCGKIRYQGTSQRSLYRLREDEMYMRKIIKYSLLIVLAAAMITGCNKKEDETEPVATTAPPSTLKPAQDDKAGVATGDDDPEEDPVKNEDLYKNKLVFEPADRNVEYNDNFVEVQLNFRIQKLGLKEIDVEVDKSRITVFYNNDDYTGIIRLLAAKGEILVKNGMGNVVLNNDNIQSINVRSDDENPGFREMEVILTPKGTEEFAEYTTQRDEDELVLSCNGKELIKIAFNQPVTDGKFTLSNIPEDDLLYDAMAAYAVSKPIPSFKG